jgi:hypothetical protein
MGKVAKLVYFSMMTRVVVDENATDEEIIKACYPSIQAKIDNNELGENLEDIDDDGECPIGTFKDDVFYQPDLEHVDVHRAIMEGTFNTFDVFKSKEKCKEVFPLAKVIEYTSGEIEDPHFCDDEWE